MKLAELHLGGFGRFEDLTLDFPAGFILILGGNEAGKTTVADAVFGLFFGFRRSLKHFRERYRPWRGGRYAASLLLAGEDGSRCLLGRDFEHDRLEIFRGREMRLEPVPESELAPILLATLGFENPLLFETTLLLRRQESGLFKRDRAVFQALAEALGLTPAREETGNGPQGPGRDPFAFPEEAAPSPAREEGDDLRALLQEQEKDRLSALAAGLAEEDRALEEKLARAEEFQARRGEKEALERELGEIRDRLAELAGEGARPGGMDSARPEELANQIASLEVELRYEEEGLRQHEAEIEILEREIAVTRAKLESLDARLLAPEIQSRLSQLLPVVNEHTARLGELFPALDRVGDGLRRLRAFRHAGLGLGFAAALASIGAHGSLPAVYCLGGAGLAALSWLGTLVFLIRAESLQGRARNLNAEIEKREGELKERRAEVESLLHGKTLGQYQAELEAKRLYERDLWHLEQTLVQKKAERKAAEGIERIGGALEAAKEELARLLAAAGCRDLAEMRLKAAAHARETAALAERLRAREEEIRGRLEELSAPVRTTDQTDPAAMAAERDEIRARLEETRSRLAELEAEIARRRAPQGGDGRMKAAAGPSGLPQEPAGPAETVEIDSGLAARMEEILAEITAGRYGQVRLAFGPAGSILKVESREAGRFLDPARLSAGSLAQVRLAMHVAFTERLAGGADPPFFLDDPFADLDEERLRLTLGFLARLSRRRQIVFLTRQGEMLRMLEEAGVTPAGVIELGGS